jgi:hypothetical protein
MHNETVYIDSENTREATDTEQRAINILKCAMSQIIKTPDVQHKSITNDCDAMELATNSVRWAMGFNRL